ncbi:MAG TPA: bifunctional diguanylate cyclase/phosphodiesterase [Acidimicrobiales bacterium]|nr:bifunctional diguanylate cyclase/phosphodiesterase [Acidimicrobiales bacterium]
MPRTAQPEAEPDPFESAGSDGRRVRRRAWRTYAVLLSILAAYLVALVLRPAGDSWTWLDGWTVVAIELVASGLCVARGVFFPRGRAVAFVLGAALTSWTIGDVVLTTQTLGGATAPSPSLADIFYIGFYPLAYVAVVLLLRQTVGTMSRPNWLDGIIAGMGAAAVCAAFAFHSIVAALGDGALATAVNLSYPIGDILLLFLVVGGTSILGGYKKGPWFLLAGGITLNVVGDTFNLFSSSGGASTVGSDLNAIAWPTSIVLMSMAVWLRPGPPDPFRQPRTAGFFLPGIAATCVLALLVVGTQRHVSETALALATTTLLVVGVRLALSARDLRVLTEQRHRQAITDELTGLGNRRQLFQVLDTFFADWSNAVEGAQTMAFLFVDLNHFKEINDSFGHPAGDELLRQVGPRLTKAARSHNVVLRLGGDEFGIVLIGADAREATEVAGRIAAELEESFEIHDVKVRIGVSIGIALVPTDARDAPGLLWCADVAMYRAKLGQTTFACYDPDIDGGEHQLLLIDELRDAVQKGALTLHYQPQLDLRTGNVVAVEALVRWPHPRLGLVPPLKFIPLAEDGGLMQPLTALVLDMALSQCAEWWSNGRYLAVSVNVSSSNLLDVGFTDLVLRLLERHHLPAEALVLEITETSIITDFEASQAVITRLREVGVLVSIDDFGAGYTSLAYLSNLAVRELKLDGALITGLGANREKRDLELVRATIDLGHAMGLRVVAEGIEDAATLELLRDLGCDLAQGYLISKPMPASELAFRATSGALSEQPV